MASPEQRLAELGITLPAAPAPAASYVPFVRHGDLVFTAGQIARGEDGFVAEGIVGRDVDLDTAVACARQCAVNVVAVIQSAAGELARVTRIVKLTVFVASAPEFTQQHVVANGASEFVQEIFGDAGVHARSAVGTAALPMNSPVEVEAIVAVAAD